MFDYISDVIDLEIYDKDGSLITKINSLKKGKLKLHEAEETYLIVEDALLNIELLKQLGEEEDETELSDFDKSFKDNDETIIKFNNKKYSTEVKIIGRGIVHNAENNSVSYNFRLIIPKAELIRRHEINFENTVSYNPKYVFKLHPYNSNEDVFQLRFKKV